MNRALAAFYGRTEDFRAVAIVLGDMSRVYQRLGDITRAIQCVEEVREIMCRVYPRENYPNGHVELAISIHNVANMYSDIYELDKFCELSMQAVDMWERLAMANQQNINRRDWAVALDQLGDAYRQAGRLAEADACFMRSTKMLSEIYEASKFPRGHHDIIMSVMRRQRLYEKQGNLAEALKCCNEALAMTEKLYGANSISRVGKEMLEAVVLSRAGVLYRLNKYGDSYRDARFSTKLRQEITDEYIPHLSEVEAINHMYHNRHVHAIHIAAWREAKAPADELYEAAWQSRGIVLRTVCERHRKAVHSESAVIRELRAELVELAQQISVELAIKKDGNATGTERESYLAMLTHQKEAKERALARESKEDDAASRFVKSPSDLQKRLGPQEVYVELVSCRGYGAAGNSNPMQYCAFVLRGNAATRFVDLGDAGLINNAVVGFRESIIGGGFGSSGGEFLRDHVWSKLERHFASDTKIVYICPDGVLCSVPWSALPSRRKGTVLLEDYSIATVPCGQYLVEWLSSQTRQSANKQFLCVGDIDYDWSSSNTYKYDLGAVETHRHDVIFKALPGGKAEIDAFANAAKGANVVMLTGRSATLDDVYRELPQARTVHFATHGYFADRRICSVLQPLRDPTESRKLGAFKHNIIARNPMLLSGLALGGANHFAESQKTDARNNGMLSAYAISLLQLKDLELAVLSACETGLGDVAGGEGVLGLQRAFHVGGAKNVIASLWKVDDEATAVLMQLFYNGLLKNGKTPLSALRDAQLAIYQQPKLIAKTDTLRSRIDFSEQITLDEKLPPSSVDARAPPRYWASFMLSGSGR